MAIQASLRRSRKPSARRTQRNLFHPTRLGGVVFFKKVWDICRIDQHLRDLCITKRGHPAWLLIFAYVLGPWMGARSGRQVADAWNRDELLCQGLGGGRRLGTHDWTRFLGRFELRRLLHAAVKQMQQWDNTACCPTRGVLALDDTPVEKSGRKMQGIRKMFDHAKNRYLWGYPIVNLTYHHRDITYPVEYRLHPKLTDNDPTKITLAKRLIDTAHELDLQVRAVLFDSGYCAVELLRHLDDCNYHWVSRLPRNRVVYIGDNRMSVKELVNQDWYRYDSLRGVHYICRQGFLNHYQLPVQLVVIRAPGKEPIVLVSSLIDTPWQEIRWLYQRRCKIETFHRDAKQRFGLGDFHCRSLRRIDDHVALAYLRYLLATLMRFVYPELGNLGWLAIHERVFGVVQHLVVERQTVRRFLLWPANRLWLRLQIRYLSDRCWLPS